MIKTILVPIDGSTLAERALPYARWLAGLTGAHLALLRALPAAEVAARYAPAEDPTARLKELTDELKGAGLDASATLKQAYFDDLGDVIASTAAGEHADLIVVSTHGRGGLGRWIYGSVTDQLIRRAPTPLLVLPANCSASPPEGRAPRILVPLDGSPLGEEALGPAAELAAASGGTLRLLRIVEYPTYAYAEGYAYVAFEPDAELEEAGKYLEEVAARLRAAGRSVEVQAEVGFPGSTIISVAQDKQCDVIALATHGRGGLVRLALGSVATALIQRAGLPLLLVRPVEAQAPAAEPTAVAPVSQEASPAAATPAAPSVVVTLSAAELRLLERGLGALLTSPERDWRVATPARRLLARLQSGVPEVSRERPHTVVVI